jgi:hypothetical protein
MESDVLTAVSVDKKRVEQLSSLLTIYGRMQNISVMATRVLETPFQNAKTATPNRTDKDQFFNLLYFCYLFSKVAASEDVVTKFQQNVPFQIDQLCEACMDFIAAVANSTVERASFERFNILFGNLISLSGIFVEFQSSIRAKLSQIQSAFDAKLSTLIDVAQLSVAEWEDWARHIEKVSKQLITVRAIAITVPAFAPKVSSLIADLLDSYLVRGSDEDAKKEFIARLGHSLECSHSNGVGQRIVEEFTIFQGHKTLIRNQQFEHVPIEKVLRDIRVLPGQSGNLKGVSLTLAQKDVLSD